MNIRKLIADNNQEAIGQALANNPALANEGLPYDEANTKKAHPLHRICDDVFINKFSDEEGVKIARIFLKHGANIDGNELVERQDTPLIAAASLYADELAFLYLDNGANVAHAGCHGGTALHWAAWCGRDKLVRRLLQEGAEINKRCIDFKATPLFWAVHGLKQGDKNDLQNHLECIKALIQSGAEKNIPNAEGKTIFDLADDEDLELKELLNGD